VATLRWSALGALVTTEQYVLLYTGAVSALIVPRRTFASAPEEQQFIETVKGYQSAGVGAAG
jgi:hypothetical protein